MDCRLPRRAGVTSAGRTERPPARITRARACAGCVHTACAASPRSSRVRQFGWDVDDAFPVSALSPHRPPEARTGRQRVGSARTRPLASRLGTGRPRAPGPDSCASARQSGRLKQVQRTKLVSVLEIITRQRRSFRAHRRTSQAVVFAGPSAGTCRPPGPQETSDGGGVSVRGAWPRPTLRSWGWPVLRGGKKRPRGHRLVLGRRPRTPPHAGSNLTMPKLTASHWEFSESSENVFRGRRFALRSGLTPRGWKPWGRLGHVETTPRVHHPVVNCSSAWKEFGAVSGMFRT